MAHVVCSLEYPIIFIFDPDYKDIEIPEYDESQVVSKNEYCLSVRVIARRGVYLYAVTKTSFHEIDCWVQ